MLTHWCRLSRRMKTVRVIWVCEWKDEAGTFEVSFWEWVPSSVYCSITTIWRLANVCLWELFGVEAGECFHSSGISQSQAVVGTSPAGKSSSFVERPGFSLGKWTGYDRWALRLYWGKPMIFPNPPRQLCFPFASCHKNNTGQFQNPYYV